MGKPLEGNSFQFSIREFASSAAIEINLLLHFCFSLSIRSQLMTFSINLTALQTNRFYD